MLHSHLMLWRCRAALLVLAAVAVAAIPCAQASTQDAAMPSAEPPAPPAAPMPPHHVAGAQRMAIRSSVTTLSNDRRNASVLFEHGDTNVYGSSGDLREARRARRGEETLWWIRKDGKRYVVRDAATIGQVKAAYAPVQALARQQGERGAQQGRLGQRQGELGEQQGAIAQRQAVVAVEQARAASAQARRAASGDQAASAAAPRTDAAQADYPQQMQALAKRQSALAEQQAGFARQQAVLAQRQQIANAALQRDIERIVQQAIAQGVAQPLAP
ncbi:hypothetical protein [Xanthomonas translucens]|uniref:hypothetical protein n=1 Tax=Xanthomonas campestris pv. translucens TaxID=343 RepID=UPI0002A7B4E8|nr:hypothetical protein [Xanthomonas translucens]AKK69070.1 hypothetical protein FD63_17090 [Xanthomonas translucens pv. undulosa]ELQ16553.1 hypothetical protein A989_01250 [Xanthomonas translucens DAR61454]MBC3972702.1 hypothetical protein [Xanthomonas translucens pv. undulosa]MCT8269273.1 hypothetical protein [Xanthomonas translucens pv. undulosa]MCT8280410.1 hypothetical protein [Xanthomonas translucens pv. undulosa]